MSASPSSSLAVAGFLGQGVYLVDLLPGPMPLRFVLVGVPVALLVGGDVLAERESPYRDLVDGVGGSAHLVLAAVSATRLGGGSPDLLLGGLVALGAAGAGLRVVEAHRRRAGKTPCWPGPEVLGERIQHRRGVWRALAAAMLLTPSAFAAAIGPLLGGILFDPREPASWGVTVLFGSLMLFGVYLARVTWSRFVGPVRGKGVLRPAAMAATAIGCAITGWYVRDDDAWGWVMMVLGLGLLAAAVGDGIAQRRRLAPRYEVLREGLARSCYEAIALYPWSAIRAVRLDREAPVVVVDLDPAGVEVPWARGVSEAWRERHLAALGGSDREEVSLRLSPREVSDVEAFAAELQGARDADEATRLAYPWLATRLMAIVTGET